MVVMVGKVEIVVYDGEWAKKVDEKVFFQKKYIYLHCIITYI